MPAWPAHPGPGLVSAAAERGRLITLPAAGEVTDAIESGVARRHCAAADAGRGFARSACWTVRGGARVVADAGRRGAPSSDGNGSVLTIEPAAAREIRARSTIWLLVWTARLMAIWR